MLDKRDDDLNPIEEKNEPNTTVPDDGASTPPNPEEPNTSEGFTANEVEAEEEPVEEEVETTPLSPVDPELKFIVDNLPEVPVRILQGDKVVEVNVKSYTQLPDDVQFASQKDALAFQSAMAAQERRAEQLQNQFKQNQQEQQQADFEQRENLQIRNDLTKLQEEGRLPKFTVQPDDPKFADDPNTQEVQKVLDFMNKRNQDYLDAYNNGGAYKHIGFEEAYEMMPETRQKEAQKLAQEQEDKTRQNNANKLSNSTGGQSPQQKRTVPRGTSLDAIVDYWEHNL